jgi:hypothetical protein
LIDEVQGLPESVLVHGGKLEPMRLAERCAAAVAGVNSGDTMSDVLTVEQIRRNYEAGLALARRYFMADADVQRAANHIASALGEMGIPYVICGGLAVTAHGHGRVTQDVDVLLTPEGLRRFKQRWLGKGWVDSFPGSRGMRDTEHNVKIDVLLTGDFPGDGKPKPVRFPDPSTVAIDIGGASMITLPKLIELKLASGMTAPDRPRDLDDVIQLVRANALPREFGDALDPWVRGKFDELWGYAQIRADE